MDRSAWNVCRRYSCAVALVTPTWYTPTWYIGADTCLHCVRKGTAMARNDDHKYESYPKDSFDNPPTGPVGVHNGRRSWPVRLTPYAIVIVVAAAVGVLFWSAFSGEAANMFKHGDRETVVASSSTTTTTSPSSTSASESESPLTECQRLCVGIAVAVAVAVAIAAPVSRRLRARAKSRRPSRSQSRCFDQCDQWHCHQWIRRPGGAAVAGAGFTNVAPSNPNGMQLPSQSVVWYQNDADLATAQKVAETLGVSTVQKAEGIAVPVAVVLMN